ncbi:MAG: PRTRC system protein C [Ignavibacteriae bacterium]|nr:PRTRC system protein C [Ignavibacteriota bacterium]
MQVTNIPRVFKFKDGNNDIEVPDPNPKLSPEEVLDLLCNQYSSLTNAIVGDCEMKDNKAVYEFKTTVGTKG